MLGKVGAPALREDDLEDFAGDDFLFRGVDDRLEIVARDVWRELGVAYVVRKREQLHARAAELFDGAVEPRVGFIEGGMRVRREEIDDDVEPLLDVIEDDDVVEKEQPRVGDAAVVRMGVGDALAPPGHAVAEETDRAAEKRRERLFAVNAQRAQLAVQHRNRIGSRFIETQAAPRLESDEGVAADVLAAFHTLQKKRLATARKCRECSDGRDGVRAQFAHDGNDVVVVSKIIQVHRHASRKSSLSRTACARSRSSPLKFACDSQPYAASMMVAAFGTATATFRGNVLMMRSPR